MIRSKMEYASSAWIGANPTSLAHRAKRVIGLPKNEYDDDRIQPLKPPQGNWSNEVVMSTDAKHPCS